MSAQLVTLGEYSQLNRVELVSRQKVSPSLTKKDKCHKLPFQTEQGKQKSHNEEVTIAGEETKGGGVPFLLKDEKCFPAEAGRENTKHSAGKRKTIGK